MKKQKLKTPKARARSSRRNGRAVRPVPADHEQPDPLESALRAAARLAEPYAEEAEAIDNVIRFVRAHRHGQAAEVRLTDLLLALSIILGATDHALTQEERDMLAVLELSLGVPTCAGIVRVPGAAPLPLAIAPRRCVPRASCYPPTSTSPAPYVRLAA